MVRTSLLGLLAVLALAPSALAAPPTVVAVTQSGGKASVAWLLPAGGQAWTVEVATAATVDGDGYFLADNVVDAQVFVDARTSWSSDETLAPGTYYVHLSGWDSNCAGCPIPEWSSVRTLTVPSPAASGSTSSSDGSTGATGSTGSTSSGTTAPSTTPAPSGGGPAPAVSGFGTVASVTARLNGNLALVAFKVCGGGNVQVNVAVMRGKASHIAVVTLPVTECASYALRLSAPGGTGRASVSVGTSGATGVTKQL